MEAATLGDVETAIAGRHERGRFAPRLEAAFEARMRGYRRKVMRGSMWPSLAIYNGFLVADWLLVPESLRLAAFLHFAVVTPVILAVGALYQRLEGAVANAVMAASVPFLMVAQIMAVYALSEAPAREHYQYLAVMIVVYSNVNLRLGYRFAAMTTAAMAAAYLGVLLPGAASLPERFVGAAMMASAAYLTLNANWRMERDLRHGFLRGLRDELLRKGAEAEAGRDPLTGLANRRRLESFVAELWQARAGDSCQLAVVMADIDHFKAFNDTYGHQGGDRCLARVADALTDGLTERDLLVRYGGEEFLMILPGMGEGDAARLAETLRRHVQALAVPHETGGPDGVVTASFGVAAGELADGSAGPLIAAADAALYASKREGRNRVGRHGPEALRATRSETRAQVRATG